MLLGDTYIYLQDPLYYLDYVSIGFVAQIEVPALYGSKSSTLLLDGMLTSYEDYVNVSFTAINVSDGTLAASYINIKADNVTVGPYGFIATTGYGYLFTFSGSCVLFLNWEILFIRGSGCRTILWKSNFWRSSWRKLRTFLSNAGTAEQICIISLFLQIIDSILRIVDATSYNGVWRSCPICRVWWRSYFY